MKKLNLTLKKTKTLAFVLIIMQMNCLLDEITYGLRGPGVNDYVTLVRSVTGEGRTKTLIIYGRPFYQKHS